MKRVLKMSLNLDSGKKKTWTLEDPKTNITKQEVETALNTAIQEQFFLSVNSYATSIDKYYIYETNEVYVG